MNDDLGGHWAPPLTSAMPDNWRKFHAVLPAWVAYRKRQIAQKAIDAEEIMREPSTHYEGLDRLKVTKGFHTSEAHLKRHMRADWQHVPIELQMFAARLIYNLRKADVPMYVHQAFRTKEQQDLLYAKGRSKPGPKVTNTQWPRAAHCQGVAVDIVHGRYHWELSKHEWNAIGKIGLQLADRMNLKLTWGGNWSFWDPAHWELTDWKQYIQPLKAGPTIHKMPEFIRADARKEFG